MSHRSGLRRAAWILGPVFLIAIVLFIVVAETGGDVTTLVLIGGLALGAVLAAPVLTLAIFLLLFIPTFLFLKRRFRRQRVVGMVVGVLAAAAAISISIPIHGESFRASTFYEVPVEITLEPSDAAYEYLYSPHTLSASYYWTDDGDDCSGGLTYELNSRVAIPRRTGKPIPLSRGPHRFAAHVRFRRKHIGAARFHWLGTAEHVRIHMPNHHLGGPDRENELVIPIREGEHELELTDRRGYKWLIRAKTLDGRARFVRVEKHLF